MPNITPLQEAFSSGEISPKLLGRVSAPGYQNGVIEMYNFAADSRGPAVRRLGTRFNAQIAGNDGRIVGLTASANSGYILLLTDLLLTPLSFEGVPIGSNLITEPRFDNGGAAWTVDDADGSVTFAVNDCTLTTNNTAAVAVHIAQQFTVTTAGDHTIACQMNDGVGAVLKIGDTQNSDEYLNLPLTGSLNSVSVNLSPGTYWYTVENPVRDLSVSVNACVAVEVGTGDNFVTPYLEADLEQIHIIPSPGGNAIYFTHPKYPVHKLTYNPTLNVLGFVAVTFTSPPAVWTGENHPRTGTFHEGRLWLGGTPDEPQTFWASKSGIYEDFTLGDLADDALEFTIAKQGSIRWMASTKNLLAGTSLGEHIVTSVEGVITPGDIQVTQQSAYGSNYTQPLQVGDQIFYVSADETKVRAMQYAWEADNWLSNDVTFFSEHITKPKIRQMAWAQNPDNKLLTTLRDGTIAALTYERGEDIFGWYRYDVGGTLKDVTSVPIDGVDVAFLLLQRVDGTLYVESIAEAGGAGEGEPDGYMDSYLRFASATPETVWPGFDHLEGEEVQILADGAVHPRKVVVGGEITLDYPAEKILAGVPSEARMTTLPLDKGSRTGSAQPYQKRYNKIYVTLLESANPLINGIRQPERSTTTPYDEAQPVASLRSQVANLGWDKNATITIVQDLPLPCTVVSISGELAMEK